MVKRWIPNPLIEVRSLVPLPEYKAPHEGAFLLGAQINRLLSIRLIV